MKTLGRKKKQSKKEHAQIHINVHEKQQQAKDSFSLQQSDLKPALHSNAGKNKLTVRRDIVSLWKSIDVADMEYLDRVMLAMHKYQTVGEISYRRIVGMHGGGGGNSSEEFKNILAVKVNKDKNPDNLHYKNQEMTFEWPNPMPNTTPEEYNLKDTPFVYTFCWHAKVPFIVWHRPLMREFERGLQMQDPDFDESDTSKDRFFGPEALGAPYWAWENWAGNIFPKVIGNRDYIFRTNKYEKLGFKQGDRIPNPYYRWLAPVDVKAQIEEKFGEINDSNCSTRDPAYEDPDKQHQYPWNQKTDNPDVNPAMSIVCSVAMTEVDFEKFGTMEPGVGSALWSIEHPHNYFHNRCGEVMPTLQSTFDPIFWLHHSNIERQFCSWQQYHFSHGDDENVEGEVPLKAKDPKSIPKPKYLDIVLYPWTKPELLKNGNYSWNTESSEANDGSLKDWFYADLSYEYEEYLEPMVVTRSHGNKYQVQLVITFEEKDLNGHFTLYSGYTKLTEISTLNGFGKGCGRCEVKEPKLGFDVSYLFWNENRKKFKQTIKKYSKSLSVMKNSEINMTIVSHEFVVLE